MRLAANGTLVLAAIVWTVVGASSARAQDCLDCHDSVTEARFVKSAHAPAEGQSVSDACRACHGAFEIVDDAHEPPPKVECGKCHQDVSRVNEGSVHRAPRPSGEGGEGEAGKGIHCWQCHEPHDIGVPKEGAEANGNGRKAIVGMCGSCHPVARDEHLDGFHGKSESGTVATCTDCHGSHNVRSGKDADSPAYRLNQSATCAGCHADTRRDDLPEGSQQRVTDYFGSVHGLAIEKSGLLVSATCVDCHGSHHIVGPEMTDSPLSRANIPALCGRCHAGVEKLYRESVHGEFFARGNTDVPVCTDCHESHRIRRATDATSPIYSTNIPNTCLKCHSDQAFISRYEMTDLRKETYDRSYHGAASKLGDTNVANCASCHEAHDIRRSTDPLAATFAGNLHKTCGKCHKTEDPSSWMAVGKIHISTAQESHWVTHLVQRIYYVLVAATLGFFVLYILLDLNRHRRNRKQGKGH
jgi:hypothetical protein